MSVITGLGGDIVSTLSDEDVLQIVANGAWAAEFMRAVSRFRVFTQEDLRSLAEDVERRCRSRAVALDVHELGQAHAAKLASSV